MKKVLLILCSILLLVGIAGCAKNQPAPQDNPGPEVAPQPTSEVNNMGDAMSQMIGYEITDEYIRIVTEQYVCKATMTEEIQQKLDAIDFFDEAREAKMAEVLSVMPIEEKTNRADYELTADQKAGLIGKKGQELLDLGYSGMGYNLTEENAIFFIELNGYSYQLQCEEKFEEKEDMITNDFIAQCTIKSIEQW